MPVAGAIVGAALSLASVVAAAKGAAALIVIGLAIAGKAITMLTANQRLANKQQGMKETVSGTHSALPVVYGSTTLGGSLLDVRVDPSSHKRRTLAYVQALCIGSRDGSGINAINDIYFDDKLAFSAAGVVQEPWDLNVQPQQLPNPTHLDVAKYLGTHSQTVDSELNSRFSSAWPTTSKVNGIAYIRYLMYFNKDVWPNGLPSSVKVKVDGNDVFDPRDSTWKFSDNPALCIRDYMLSDGYGLGLSTSDIDEQSFIDAADFCDENPAFGTAPRFTCNGAVDTGKSLRENLNELLSSCRGQIIFQNGQFRLHIPKTQTAMAYEITEDDIIGDFQWQRAGQRDTANSVTASYVDSSLDDSVNDVTWPEPGQTNDALTKEDNNVRNNKEIQLPFTTDEEEAKIIAMVTMKESREDTTASFTVNEEGLQMEVGDVVRVTHDNPGWTQKKFWVSSLSLASEGGVVVGLSEYSDQAYALDPFNTSTPPPGTDLNDPYSISPPTNVTVASDAGSTVELGDGSELPRVLVTWTEADEPHLDYTQIRFRPVTQADGTPLTDQPWQPGHRVDAGDDQQVYLDQVKANWEYEVEIRSVTVIGGASDWVNNNITVTPNANQRPIILVETEESGNTGTVTATLIDTGGGTIDVDWYARTGQEAYPGTPDQTDLDVQSGNSVQFTTSLDAERNTFVRIVATLDANGNDNSEEVTLDTNDTPVLEHLGATVDEDTGEVVVAAEGDADTENIYINVGENAAPADPTPSTHDHQITGRSGTEGTGVNIGENSLGFVKAVPEKTSTGTLGEVASAIAGRGTAGGGLPIILVDTSETASQGTLDATPIDPDGGTLTVRFFTRQGHNSSYAATPDNEITGVASGTTKTHNVSLIEGANSWIKCEAEVESSGDKASVEVAFDQDKVPEVENLFASADGTGNVVVSAGGDSDTQSIDVDITGAFTEDLSISGRSGSDTTSNTLDFGQSITITATPYTGSSETGTAGPTKSINYTREKGETPPPPDERTENPSVELTVTERTDDPLVDVNITGTVGAEGSAQGNIQIEWRIGGGSWNREATDNFSDVMAGGVYEPLTLFARAVDTGLSPEKFSDVASGVLPPLLAEFDFPTGGGPSEFPREVGGESGDPREPFDRRGIYSEDGLTLTYDPVNLTLESVTVDGTLGADFKYPSGTFASNLEPAEAGAEKTTGADWSVMSNSSRVLDNIEGGTLTKGLIQDTSGSAGIRLDPNDTLPGTWVRYIDLTADAAGEFFIKHPALDLEGNGDALFTGKLQGNPIETKGVFRALSTFGSVPFTEMDDFSFQITSGLDNNVYVVKHDTVLSDGESAVITGFSHLSVQMANKFMRGEPSSGQIENIVHHGAGSASSVGVDGTLHTEDV